jgi:hypothetical protein
MAEFWNENEIMRNSWRKRRPFDAQGGVWKIHADRRGLSFGAAASCTNYPSGFARVTSFLGWIDYCHLPAISIFCICF